MQCNAMHTQTHEPLSKRAVIDRSLFWSGGDRVTFTCLSASLNPMYRSGKLL